jgi:hypothetical protein
MNTLATATAPAPRAFTIQTPYGPRLIVRRSGPLAYEADGSAWREDGCAWDAVCSPAPDRGPTRMGEALRDMTERAHAQREAREDEVSL